MDCCSDRPTRPCAPAPREHYEGVRWEAQLLGPCSLTPLPNHDDQLITGLQQFGHRDGVLAVQPGRVPVHRRRRGGRRLGDRADLHRADRAGPDPRPTGVAAAAGDRAWHLPGAAGRLGDRLRRGWVGEGVAAGPGGLAVDVPLHDGGLGALRRAGADHPRVATASGGQGSPGRGTRGAAPGAWEHRPGRQGHPDQGHACARDPTGHAGPARPCAGIAADRVGRHPAVGVSAVRRHQRDLLLLQRAVAGGRVQRGRRAAHHGDQHRGERPDHAGRHRRWSPSPRSTASAAVRCC